MQDVTCEKCGKVVGVAGTAGQVDSITVVAPFTAVGDRSGICTDCQPDPGLADVDARIAARAAAKLISPTEALKDLVHESFLRALKN
jgi:hypothetical protein